MQSTLIDPSQPAGSVGEEYIRYCRRRLVEEFFPRIGRCLDEIPEEDVWWRLHETDNSIGNLILHLSGNVRQWIVVGLGEEKDSRNRPLEFAERSAIPKDLLLKQLTETIKQASRTLEEFPAEKLLEMRHIQKYDVTCLDAISHVVEHFAQHLGQIIYITKLRTGRDLKFYDL